MVGQRERDWICGAISWFLEQFRQKAMVIVGICKNTKDIVRVGKRLIVDDDF